MNFKNMNVKFKIMMPVALISILLVISSLTSIRIANNMLSIGQKISGNYSASLTQLGKISEKFEKLNGTIYKHCIATNSEAKEQLVTEYENTINEISKLIANFKKRLNTSKETEIFNKFQENYNAYLTDYKTAINASASGQGTIAAQMANDTLITQSAKIEDNITQLQKLNRAAMDNGVLKQTSVYRTSQISGIILLIAGLILGLSVIYICYKAVCRPVARMNKELTDLIDDINSGHGDLTKRVYVAGNDEIGVIGISVNHFIETLQNIMKKITNNTNQLESIVGTVTDKVVKANDNSCDISAVMEELSSSMEEVSATVISVNDNTNSVDSSISELSDESIKLFDYVNEMKVRANELEETAVKNGDNANQIISEIVESLENAIEESKSVDKVNDLTMDILNISSQTNLLALNASIEAARAGEAGKGFAVVADEIRQLADNSRNTANSIQEISEEVVSSVEQLAVSSDKLLEYVTSNVQADYDKFVTASAQYLEDADTLENMMADFENKTSNLLESSAHVGSKIVEISDTIEEEKNRVEAFSGSVDKVLSNMDEIQECTNVNEAVSKDLKKEIAKFSVI